ncbi:hypothetical protein, partial [Xenorhabdus innexi]|uniref:hypothetical protein n=1 Tax=Xenorhabdus innexi TaxID=290109 RepID=UPI001FD318A0
MWLLALLLKGKNSHNLFTDGFLAICKGNMEIFFTILILILVVSVSGVLTKVIPFRVPLPIVQIAMGALLAWPHFGLHV